MLHNKKLKYLIASLVSLAIIIGIIVIVVNRLPKGYATPYEACRDVAMHTQGYDIWTYDGNGNDLETEMIIEGQRAVIVSIHFTDGLTTLGCSAKKIGTLWYINGPSFQTMKGYSCPYDGYPCPKIDYHGVSP